MSETPQEASLPPENGAGLRAILALIEQLDAPSSPKPKVYPTSRLTFEKRGRK